MDKTHDSCWFFLDFVLKIGPSKSHPAALVLWHGGTWHVFYQQTKKNTQKKHIPKTSKTTGPPQKKERKTSLQHLLKIRIQDTFLSKPKESTTSLPKPVAPRNSDQNDGPSKENTHHRDQSPNFLWSACKLLQVVVSPLQRKNMSMFVEIADSFW